MTDTHETQGVGGRDERVDRVDSMDQHAQQAQGTPASPGQSETASAELAPAEIGLSSDGAIKEMLTIAIPSVATMTSYTIMAMVDKFMVKEIGEEPVYIAAQSNGSMFVWMFMAFLLGMTGVINSFVSQNLGAKTPERGAAYVWNGLWMSLAYFVLLMVPMYWVLPGLFGLDAMFGKDPQLASLSTEYAQIVLLGGIFVLTARSLHHYFYGMHRPNVVLVSALVGNITNVIVNLLLIFGEQGMPIPDHAALGPIVSALTQPIASLAGVLGIEAMGMRGAAIGTVLGGMGEFIIPFVLFVSPRYARLFGTRKAWRVSVKCLRDLVKVGFAPGFMFLNEMVCWTILMVKLVPMGGERVGDDPVLHNTVGWIALQYMHLSFMPAVGISIATQAMVGKAMGMGRPDIAVARTMLALKLTLGYMGFCALCFVIFPKQLLGLLINEQTPAEEVARLIEIGVPIMIAAAVFQLFDAVAITLTGSLRGAGDTTWPGVATVILSWVCIPGLGLLLIYTMPELGSIGPWIGASLYIIGLGLALGFRFKMGKWKTMSLVENGTDTGVDSDTGSGSDSGDEPPADPPVDLDPFDNVMPDPTTGRL